jgi:hypothetical protein
MKPCDPISAKFTSDQLVRARNRSEPLRRAGSLNSAAFSGTDLGTKHRGRLVNLRSWRTAALSIHYIEGEQLTTRSPNGIRRLGVTSLPPHTGVCVAAVAERDLLVEVEATAVRE